MLIYVVIVSLSGITLECVLHVSKITVLSNHNDPPDPRRLYTIMSAEEAANGKKSHWAELEITGLLICLAPSIFVADQEISVQRLA